MLNEVLTLGRTSAGGGGGWEMDATAHMIFSTIFYIYYFLVIVSVRYSWASLR